MNIVWIIIDCLRADRLGCYGYRRRVTPHIDRLAPQSVRFTQCISPHIPTQPAHTTMFTGRDVFDHQIVAQGGAQELAPAVSLLPLLLREAGYTTAAVDNIGRWFRDAFEHYDDYPRWNHDGSLPWRVGEQVTERGLRLLDQCAAPERPFFLFLHYWDPHTPYLPPPPFDRMFYGGDEKDPAHTSMAPVWQSEWFANYFREWLEGVTDIEFVKAQYDASIAYVDLCVSHVLNRLAELGRAEDTLLILGADHGEELDDHGCWFDHHGLYDTNVRVPLLLRYPDRLPAGVSVDGMVSLLDLTPTVLDLAGVAAPEGMVGRSLEPTWTAPGAAGTHEAVYLTECTWMRKRGWRTADGWKLIRALEPDIYGKPDVELYHLATDPGERHNLAGDDPARAAALTAAMEDWIAARLRATGRPDPSVAQADALRQWQPRFVAGRRTGG
jgi:arylsulfatase A-like enzyme